MASAEPARVWSPAQYAKFQRERSLPARDLMELLRPRPDGRVLDLGCGDGRLTRELHLRLRARETLGVERDGAMLERARALPSDGRLRFAHADLDAPWAPVVGEAPYDVVFSNACLQWLRSPHTEVFARLKLLVASGGQLAVQLPANHHTPTHTTAEAVARSEPFAGLLDGFVRTSPVLSAEDYARILHDLGFAEQRVQRVIYPHVLPDREAAVEWVRGSLLTAYQRRLSPEDFERFLEAYREELFAQLPDERPLFYPFARVLIWASCLDSRRFAPLICGGTGAGTGSGSKLGT